MRKADSNLQKNLAVLKPYLIVICIKSHASYWSVFTLRNPFGQAGRIWKIFVSRVIKNDQRGTQPFEKKKEERASEVYD